MTVHRSAPADGWLSEGWIRAALTKGYINLSPLEIPKTALIISTRPQ